MKPRSFTVDYAIQDLLDAQDAKWRRARRMIRNGYSAKRIAELVELPELAIRLTKQAGDW